MDIENCFENNIKRVYINYILTIDYSLLATLIKYARMIMN